MAKKEKKAKVERTNNVPSSPADRARLHKMVKEAADARTMIDAQKDKLKDVKTTILEEFPITGRLMNKLIDFEYRQNFDEVAGLWQEIMTAQEAIQDA